MLPCLYHGNVMFCCCFVSVTMLLWSSYLKCNVKELINSIQIQELQFEFMNVDFKLNILKKLLQLSYLIECHFQY